MRYLALSLAAFTLSAAPSFAELAGESAEDQRAKSLINKADLKYDVREYTEAIEMYKNIIDRFPKSKYRFTSHLRLGKHYFGEKQYEDAVGQFTNVPRAAKRRRNRRKAFT